jgi:hypothetical protein
MQSGAVNWISHHHQHVVAALAWMSGMIICSCVCSVSTNAPDWHLYHVEQEAEGRSSEPRGLAC